MSAKELRTLARRHLRGKWGVAIAICLVAGLLLQLPSLGVNIGSTDMIEKMEYLDFSQIAPFLAAIGVISSLLNIAVFVVSGAVNFGLSDFFIRLVKGEPVKFKQLFGHFDRIGQGIVYNLVVGLFTFLWSLLFFFPGIIAIYRYAMVPYLMAEFPDLGVMDAIRESKRLMHGNKFRLFCLELSFFGWALLAVLTLGIGLIWLTPYMNAATAAFYMDVTGRGENLVPEQPIDPEFLNRGPEI